MIRTKLFPTFGKKMLSEIETRDIIAWQNELLAYRDEKNQPYSPTYLNSIHNQLVAILNHAVRHYRQKSNTANKLGYIGSKEAEEMQFWTKEEYQRFAEAVMDLAELKSKLTDLKHIRYNYKILIRDIPQTDQYHRKGDRIER